LKIRSNFKIDSTKIDTIVEDKGLCMVYIIINYTESIYSDCYLKLNKKSLDLNKK